MNDSIPRKHPAAKSNLNSEQLRFASPGVDWQNNPYNYQRVASLISENGDIVAHFDGLEDALIREIKQADVVFGCVAWLTNTRILTALASKDVSIVVQKEDFLRPDMSDLADWKSNLRRQYNALKCTFDRVFVPYIAVSGSNVHGDPSINPVRCMGNYNRDKLPASPRMHHKFVVFAKRAQTRLTWSPDGSEYDWTEITPYAVWTGSFNFTQNAIMSLENALVIRDECIVNAYMHEYAHVFALSETLDWEQDWVAPEYRIGT